MVVARAAAMIREFTRWSSSALAPVLMLSACGDDDGDGPTPLDGGAPSLDAGLPDASLPEPPDATLPDDASAPDANLPDAPEAGLDGGGLDCATPSMGLIATFDVVGEAFRINLTGSAAIADAIALWRGESTANIPNGLLVCEPADFNCGYSWHLQPGTVEFAEITIEVCDGTPSYIEENCEQFVSNYCPWSAELIDLKDCRSDGGCTNVPR